MMARGGVLGGNADTPRHFQQAICKRFVWPSKAGLLDLDHASARGFLYFLGALDDAMGESVQRLGMRRLVSFEYDRLAAVAALADVGIEFDVAQEWNAELRRGALAAALGEDINRLVAVRADEVAHVLR